MSQKGRCPFCTSPQTAVFDPREHEWRLRLVMPLRSKAVVISKCVKGPCPRRCRGCGPHQPLDSFSDQKNACLFTPLFVTYSSRIGAERGTGTNSRCEALRSPVATFGLLSRLDAAPFGYFAHFVGCALHYAGRFVSVAGARLATPDNPLCGLRFPCAADAVQHGYLGPATAAYRPFPVRSDQAGNPSR